MGKVLLHYESLNSTNQKALDLLATKNKPSEGTIISTSNQVAGRGQSGSSWLSEKDKNLTISLILYPDFLPVRKQFLLSQAICLAVAGTVLHYLPNKKVKIKWPNDIYVNDQKIAGLLIQNSISAARLQSSVIGIGLNVNQDTFSKVIPNPTSFFLENQQTIDLDELLDTLGKNLEFRYLQLRRQDFDALEQDYLDCLYRFQKDAYYQKTSNGELFRGKIVALEPGGKLVIAHTNGQTAFNLKEIRFV